VENQENDNGTQQWKKKERKKQSFLRRMEKVEVSRNENSTGNIRNWEFKKSERRQKQNDSDEK
jgi:hypothetical protein